MRIENFKLLIEHIEVDKDGWRKGKKKKRINMGTENEVPHPHILLGSAQG
jgi:hypothetical protein